MDFQNYRQHPKFGEVVIQMKLKNNEFSVLKLMEKALEQMEMTSPQ